MTGQDPSLKTDGRGKELYNSDQFGCGWQVDWLDCHSRCSEGQLRRSDQKAQRTGLKTVMLTGIPNGGPLLLG